MHARLFHIKPRIYHPSLSSDLLVASKKGDVREVSSLLKRGAPIHARDVAGNTPLHLATYFRKIETIKLLLARNADPFSHNDNGQTPFHLACLSVPPFVEKGEFKQAIQDFEETIRTYQRYEFNINDIQKDQQTSYLSILAGCGAIEAVKIAVSYGANVALENPDGSTPIEHAIQLNQFANRQIEVVKFLLDQGVQPVSIDKADDSPAYTELKQIMEAKMATQIRIFFS